MAVRQLPKNKATKDGRRWCFYDRIKVNGITKTYVSKNYMTRNEALKAEREFLVGFDKKDINVTDMTFKQLFEEFYEFSNGRAMSEQQREMMQSLIEKIWEGEE